MRLLHLCLFLTAISAASAAPNFVDDVLPIFKEHCLSCHNPDKKKADLDLSTVQGVEIGGSGGSIVKAGVPDTSVLYLVIDHDEDYEPMPPKKPKITEAELQVIHSWIGGGLLETADGKSQLRDVSFDLSAGSTDRPDEPALPTSLPIVPVAKTRAPAPIVALASSPWVNLVATSGHQQVHLYGPTTRAIEAPGFSPLGEADLLSRHEFEEAPAEMQGVLQEGHLGQGLFLQGSEFVDDTVPGTFPNEAGALTLCAWILPDKGSKSPAIWGRNGLHVFLEPRTNGWTLRAAVRSEDNGSMHYGRQGLVPEGKWTHIAMTYDGKEWAFYIGGREVVRQPEQPDHPGLKKDENPFYFGGAGSIPDRLYHGGIDDLRVYRRALSAEEIRKIHHNASPQFGHIGTLPFPEGTVHDLQFSRNGELLVAAGGVGARSGQAVVFDVRTGERKAVIGDEQDVVLCADISSDHKLVAIGTPSKLVKIFSAETGKMLHRIEKHTDWVTALRFRPDGRMLATGDRNGGIHVWEADNGGIVYTLDEHKEKVNALSWRADGQLLASGAEDGKFVLWDMKDGWPTRTGKAHEATAPNRYSRTTGILDLAFSREGGLATVGRDRCLRLWGPDGNALASAENLAALPTRVAWGAEGDLLFTGDLSGRLRVWNSASASRLQSLLP